jgi:hypothetical protein
MTLVNDHECCMAIEGCMAIQSHGTAHACAMTIGFGTLALSHETPDDRSGSSRWQRMKLTLEQHPLAVHGQCMDPIGSLALSHA